jgi:hypothetical protein
MQLVSIDLDLYNSRYTQNSATGFYQNLTAIFKILNEWKGREVPGPCGVGIWAGPGGFQVERLGEKKEKGGARRARPAWPTWQVAMHDREDPIEGRLPSASSTRAGGTEREQAARGSPATSSSWRRGSGGAAAGRGRVQARSAPSSRPLQLLPRAPPSQRLPARRWRRWPPVVLGSEEGRVSTKRAWWASWKGKGGRKEAGRRLRHPLPPR